MDKFNKLKLKETFEENMNEIKKQYNMNNTNDKNKYKKDKYKILLELNKFIHNSSYAG